MNKANASVDGGEHTQHRTDASRGHANTDEPSHDVASATTSQQEGGTASDCQSSAAQSNEGTASAPMLAVDALSAHALSVLKRCRIHLMAGSFTKQCTGKRKLAGKFAAATVGSHHVHLLKAEHGLVKVVQPGALVAAESVKNLVNMKPEHVDKFEATVADWAEQGGLLAKGKECAPEGHMLFGKPMAAHKCG